MNRRSLKIFAASFASIAVLAIAILSSYMFWERGPDVTELPVQTVPVPPSAVVTTDLGIPFESGRKDGVYTILLVGNDDGNGNTDTIMICKMNTKLHTMDFVSIPRDTLINVNWDIRKINSVYWTSRYYGENGIDALRQQIKKLIGFDVDCYAVIDLNVFVDIVDALGGVYFDVPQPLHYEDPWQDLYIHIEPGYQLLDGYNAMGLCRYRSGYINGDIGRINMQHDFLKACAKQFTQLGKIPDLGKVVELLSENLDTNMSSANFAYFIRHALLCNEENIRFHTAPTIEDTVHGYSYAVLDMLPWLEMINTILNPYTTEVSLNNLDVVYKDGTTYKSTGYLQGENYYRPDPIPTTVPSKPPKVHFEETSDPEYILPEPIMPSPDITPSIEYEYEEMTVPYSIGNIIIDY